MPPITNPPVIIPPPTTPTYPPYTGPPPSGGGGVPGVKPPPTSMPTCPINALKLGLCLDVLGGLVHVGLGDPVENVCCPVLQGLLELEAAVCLCTTIRLKLLNLNIFLPLALSVIATCGKTPPPGFVCPPLP
ncbi:hypothetical protein DCAR_0831677 [Daucus carota subsp. sativus]|uniref:Bifunctional inhibitor/plant lipid transfer protein/seed storage helical domain-containing protein n=2 Tax=Daucus carota subsp. sativus TaxID=79200 RepID=A0AAF0XQB8_DAUCS|nr:hypothetical protein DCAR_0831677 [Daucus carota subsp. sativus]